MTNDPLTIDHQIDPVGRMKLGGSHTREAAEVLRLLRLTSLSMLFLALLTAADAGAVTARAQADSVDPDWTLTALGDPVVRLFTPASGAFFAQTAETFLRSDDGGSTWRSVRSAQPRAF